MDTPPQKAHRSVRSESCFAPPRQGCGHRILCISKRVKSILLNWGACAHLDYRSARRLSTLAAVPLLGLAPLGSTYLGSGHAQSPPASRELRIAAAADLRPVLPALLARYRNQTGTQLTPSFDSSATLTEQIRNGAPNDLFLSADCAHPQQLVDAHLAADPKPTHYARGVLVLWARKDSPAQPLSLDALTGPHVTRIAVANGLHAPYGAAAMAALRALKLEDRLAGKLVQGENIAQTAEFAYTGSAQAAFISLTIADSPPYRAVGSFIQLPPAYPPILQCAIVLKSSTNQPAAEAFLAWLTSSAIQRQLPALGLEPAQ